MLFFECVGAAALLLLGRLVTSAFSDRIIFGRLAWEDFLPTFDEDQIGRTLETCAA